MNKRDKLYSNAVIVPQRIFFCIYIFVLCLQGFLKRHKDVSIRTPERVSKARVGVSEDAIREWFSLLNDYLKNNLEGMMGNPSRILNCDEICIQLCPSTGKVLSITGYKNIYELAPAPDKSNLTFLETFRADGATVTPMVIYPYIRLPRDIAESVPDHFFMATSDCGWMKS